VVINLNRVARRTAHVVPIKRNVLTGREARVIGRTHERRCGQWSGWNRVDGASFGFSRVPLIRASALRDGSVPPREAASSHLPLPPFQSIVIPAHDTVALAIIRNPTAKVAARRATATDLRRGQNRSAGHVLMATGLPCFQGAVNYTATRINPTLNVQGRSSLLRRPKKILPIVECLDAVPFASRYRSVRPKKFAKNVRHTIRHVPD
jgi:hypothetical protein